MYFKRFNLNILLKKLKKKIIYKGLENGRKKKEMVRSFAFRDSLIPPWSFQP